MASLTYDCLASDWILLVVESVTWGLFYCEMVIFILIHAKLPPYIFNLLPMVWHHRNNVFFFFFFFPSRMVLQLMVQVTVFLISLIRGWGWQFAKYVFNIYIIFQNGAPEWGYQIGKEYGFFFLLFFGFIFRFFMNLAALLQTSLVH